MDGPACPSTIVLKKSGSEREQLMSKRITLIFGLFEAVVLLFTTMHVTAQNIPPNVRSGTTPVVAEFRGADGIYSLSDARGPIRHADTSSLKKDVSSEILAGPSNGLDSAFVIYTRMAPGAHKRGLYTLPVDHTYLVLFGKLNIQLGTDEFVVEPQTLVLVPAGVPHQAWNSSSDPVQELEVITPAPSRDLVSMMKSAVPRKIENAAQYVRVAPPMQLTHSGVGAGSLNERVLADRGTGSAHMLERLDDVLPGSGRGETHVHPFDQVYFIRKGIMSLQYGLGKYEAPEGSLVLIPAGVIHSNMNNTSDLESHLTLMLPQPQKGTPAGRDVEFVTSQQTPATKQ
jgi:mannose-6-phosphate isomerase-like protein (cupin superfamily)